ncbi:amidase [Martelella sp. HB161492]|uniref:amidase n=1 Tax=Martelella sp. HB161492 TaxID=2720726 RepID=UPI001591EE68|nr:amidase [Martelella sp. HB161492]
MMEDISSLSEALANGTLTAEALLERSLARIAAGDPALNAFVAMDVAGARRAAKASDARRQRGALLSPIDGIPLSIKDNILVKDMPATWGSRAFADFMPATDELPVARLRAAGAIIIGKTNVPELTLDGFTSNDLFGTTRNPWNNALTPGGSSGGAAASVAAGFVPAAMGTDGGGSTRRPACHTGLVGWKPSSGHMPRLDGFPAILTDFEVIGLLTRSVRDAAILDQLLRAPDPRDRRSMLETTAPPIPAAPRILFVPTFGDIPVDPEVSSACRRFVDGLRERGATVTESALFFDLDSVNEIWRVISRSGVAYMMDWHHGALKSGASPSVRALAEDGAAISGADYIGALEKTAALRAGLAGLFAQYDLVITPTAGALPWPVEKPYPDMIDGRPAGPRDHAVFTGWVNVGGLPAISLPIAISRETLPIGIQLVAAFGADAALLDFAEGLWQHCIALPDLPQSAATQQSGRALHGSSGAF